MIEVELPYPPSMNHYWRNVGRRVLISREGRRFREDVIAILTALRIQPMTGDLFVEIVVHPPDRRIRDVDNSIKPILDALEHGGAYANDRQIRKLTIERGEPVKGGNAVVRISEFA